MLCDSRQDGGESTRSEVWLERYAAINVVRNFRFANKWLSYVERGATFAESIGPYCIVGGSREAPTPFVYLCHKVEGCTFTSIVKQHRDVHEASCNPEAVATRAEATLEYNARPILVCDEEGCDYTTRSKESLRHHISGVHKFIPKACQHGCDPQLLYTTNPTYDAHIRKMHRVGWPTPCLFPGCEHPKEFSSENSLKSHLRNVHKITDMAEIIKYFPPLPQRQRPLPLVCDQGGQCDAHPYTHVNAQRLRRHLQTSAHKLTEQEASAWVESHRTYEWFTPERPKLATPRPMKRKSGDLDDVVIDNTVN